MMNEAMPGVGGVTGTGTGHHHTGLPGTGATDRL
jgi:hypothetical protein